MGKQGSGGDPKGPAEGEYSDHRVAKPLLINTGYELNILYIIAFQRKFAR